jgi:hypothetical protein
VLGPGGGRAEGVRHVRPGLKVSDTFCSVPPGGGRAAAQGCNVRLSARPPDPRRSEAFTAYLCAGKCGCTCHIWPLCCGDGAGSAVENPFVVAWGVILRSSRFLRAEAAFLPPCCSPYPAFAVVVDTGATCYALLFLRNAAVFCTCGHVGKPAHRNSLRAIQRSLRLSGVACAATVGVKLAVLCRIPERPLGR